MKLKAFVVLFLAFNALAAPTHPPGVTPVHYVSPEGAHAAPFTTWENAANDIQSAVDAAVDGDTVLVGDGHYTSGGLIVSNLPNRVVLTKQVVVQSVNGPESTLIVGDGPVGAGAVRCAYLTTESQLIGFTLTNGHTHATGRKEWDSIGGGAFVIGGSLSDCIIISNSAYQGGGINFQEGGSASNCVVSSNFADFTGGGVRFHFGGYLDDCTISHNLADYGGGVDFNRIGELNNCTIISNSANRRGGGLWCYNGGTVSNCSVIANSAVLGGGGVYCAGGGTLVNCFIMSNSNSVATQNYGGGGVYCSNGGMLHNCVISGNSARNGGGVDFYTYEGRVGTLSNCTIVGNSAAEFGGGIRCLEGGELINSIAWSNMAMSEEKDILYQNASIKNSCSPDLVHGVDGNITNAPLFVDPDSGDYRLMATSPCIDAGSNGVVSTGTDLAGMDRIIDGDLDGTATVDMGAYEFQVITLPEMVLPTINLKSKGRTPVSIVTTDDFDATSIDPSTVRFAGATPVKHSQKDEDGDGDIDLKLHFKTQDLTIDPSSGEVTLMGQTFDGVLVVGMDAVKVVPEKISIPLTLRPRSNHLKNNFR